MKKPAVLIFALACFSFLNAQVPFSFGPKVGFNTNKLSINIDEIKESFSANVYSGFFARFGNEKFLQPELNLTTKGGFFSRNDVFNAREITLSTLELPLLVGTKLTDFKMLNIRMMMGPSVSFILDKEIVMRSPAVRIDPDELKNAIWGLQAGVGIDVLMLTLDIRYEVGLNNISAIDGIEIRNALFNVSLGWKLF